MFLGSVKEAKLLLRRWHRWQRRQRFWQLRHQSGGHERSLYRRDCSWMGDFSSLKMHASARRCDKKNAFHQIVPWPHFQVARRGDSLAHRQCRQEKLKLALMAACLAHLVASYSLCWYLADQTGPWGASSPQVSESVPGQFVLR